MLDPLHTVIESERLRLGPTSAVYAGEILRVFTPEITRYMFPKPPDDLGEVLAFIDRSRDEMARGEALIVAVVDKITGEFLGHGGLHHIDGDTPELGIWIKKEGHGHHYGREAVTALAGWAEANLAYRYLIYPVDHRNTASRKIPESLGGVIEDEHEQVGEGGQALSLLEYRIYPNARAGG